MVKIQVEYCNSWGYGSKFEQLKKQLLAKHTKLEMEGKPSGDKSGCFEVQVVDGDLLYSKLKTKEFPSDKDVEAINVALEKIGA